MPAFHRTLQILLRDLASCRILARSFLAEETLAPTTHTPQLQCQDPDRETSRCGDEVQRVERVSGWEAEQNYADGKAVE